jgi:hypothetical protein
MPCPQDARDPGRGVGLADLGARTGDDDERRTTGSVGEHDDESRARGVTSRLYPSDPCRCSSTATTVSSSPAGGDRAARDQDLAVQGRYGVRYHAYGTTKGTGALLPGGRPSKEAVDAVHVEAHGLAPTIIELDPTVPLNEFGRDPSPRRARAYCVADPGDRVHRHLRVCAQTTCWATRANGTAGELTALRTRSVSTTGRDQAHRATASWLCSGRSRRRWHSARLCCARSASARTSATTPLEVSIGISG